MDMNMVCLLFINLFTVSRLFFLSFFFLMFSCFDFGDDIELEGAEITAEEINYVSELTGLSFPHGTEPVGYYFLGSGIDRSLALKVAIPEAKREDLMRNDIFKNNLIFSEYDLKIYKSKVISTNHDQFRRYLVLENGIKINTSLVLSADGNASSLRKLSNIKYINHNLDHTKRVISAAVDIGSNYDLSEKDWRCLLTACLLHDYGFIESHVDHEKISEKLSSQILPKYGFSETDIQIINSLIIVTKLEEKPKNLLESIIRDSDLEYLGSEDFIKISPLLKQEWINCKVVKSDSEFYKIQYEFILNHSFYTDFMIKNSINQKKVNIDYAKSMI